jgi:hypothetical protein
MRRILFLVLLLSSIGSLAAQSGFSWGLNLYPNLSDRRLINSGGRLSEKAIAELDQLEKAAFSYAAGLDMQWQSETVGLNLGLRYRTAGYSVGRTILLPDDPNGDFADESEAQYTESSVELPVEMLFFFGLDDNRALFFSMGTAFSYQLDAQNELTLFRTGGPETRIVDPPYEYRRFNYAFQTGIGWQMPLSEQLLLSIQPNFQFWFKGIYEDRAEINRNLYNLGLKVGLRFWRPVE